MQISEAMQERLNEQVRVEFGAEHQYLAISANFDRLGLKVFSRFFRAQATEEREHALKMVDYLMRVGAEVKLRGVDAPQTHYESGEAMVQAALASEEFVTARIHDIARLADEEQDYATRGFIAWFVDEQIEELERMGDLLTLVQMAGEERLFMLEGRLYHMIEGSH